MRTLSASVLAAIGGAAVGMAQLVRVELASGNVLLCTANRDITWDGLTYKGAYGLGTITPVDDKPGEAQSLQLRLDGGASARISLALDAADEVQGAPVEVLTAFVDLSTHTVLDAQVDWAGRADTMSVQEDGDKASLILTAESNAAQLLRGNPSTYSHADQKTLFSGDRAFEYVVSQSDQTVIWPSKEFFYK